MTRFSGNLFPGHLSYVEVTKNYEEVKNAIIQRQKCCLGSALKWVGVIHGRVPHFDLAHYFCTIIICFLTKEFRNGNLEEILCSIEKRVINSGAGLI